MPFIIAKTVTYVSSLTVTYVTTLYIPAARQVTNLSVRLNGINVGNWCEFAQHFLRFKLVLRGRLVAAPTNGWCDKQQFTTLLSQTEKHKIFLEFFQSVSLLHPFLCYT